MNTEDAIGLVNRHVLDLDSYHLTPLETEVKLNQNENPFDRSHAVKSATAEYILSRPWNRYPDFIPDELKGMLASFFGVESDNVIVGNGSNEMLLVLMMAFAGPGKTVIICEPTFTVYKLLGKGLGSTVKTLMMDPDLSYNVKDIRDAAVKNPESFLILCSPNNPTGTTLDKEEVESILAVHSGIFLLDQAYVDFGGYNALELVEKYPNLIITRTFSKAMGAAGLRLGCMIGSKTLIHEINKIKLPYNINFMPDYAARQILTESDVIAREVAELINERKVLYNALRSLPFEHIYPGGANFLLVRSSRKSAIFSFLKEKSILVRDVSSYPLLADCMRISVGSTQENYSQLVHRLDTAYGRQLQLSSPALT